MVSQPRVRLRQGWRHREAKPVLDPILSRHRRAEAEPSGQGTSQCLAPQKGKGWHFKG